MLLLKAVVTKLVFNVRLKTYFRSLILSKTLLFTVTIFTLTPWAKISLVQHFPSLQCFIHYSVVKLGFLSAEWKGSHSMLI